MEYVQIYIHPDLLLVLFLDTLCVLLETSYIHFP